MDRHLIVVRICSQEAPPPAAVEDNAPQGPAGDAQNEPQQPQGPDGDADMQEEREQARRQQREAERLARIDEDRLVREGATVLVSHILRSARAGHWLKDAADELSRVSLFKILYAHELADFARSRARSFRVPS